MAINYIIQCHSRFSTMCMLTSISIPCNLEAVKKKSAENEVPGTSHEDVSLWVKYAMLQKY